MHWNIPNTLTVTRILMIPIFVGIFYMPVSVIPAHWVNFSAAVLFALAALTDWFDGYLARKLNQTSAFGAFLDPVADKLMVAAALVVLVDFERVGAVIAFIIIGREIAISALREWARAAAWPWRKSASSRPPCRWRPSCFCFITTQSPGWISNSLAPCWCGSRHF